MRKTHKKHKDKDLDLIPVMNLFSILVVVVISMTTFEKLGVLELWLPERGQAQPEPNKTDIDESLLNLTVVITNKGVTIGAAGGFQPTIFYQEEIAYRSRSDQHVFRKVFVAGEEVKSPTDGKIMTPYERETIMLNSVVKKDSSDPGTYQYAAISAEGNALMDTAGNWYSKLPAVGELYRVVGDETLRRMDARNLPFCKLEKLSAYQEVAKTLEKIHTLYSQKDPLPPDVDDVVILADEEVVYDKIIQMMDACKSAGFDRVALSLIGGEV
ncbi:MAG: biopolymer transporter ExbD [Fibrobacterota bacterium]|nr:biopolymer transporter ExbD [Fibrobacterota bacterium]